MDELRIILVTGARAGICFVPRWRRNVALRMLWRGFHSSWIGGNEQSVAFGRGVDSAASSATWSLSPPRKKGGGGRCCLLLALLSHLTVDHAMPSLSKRSAVLILLVIRDTPTTSNILPGKGGGILLGKSFFFHWRDLSLRITWLNEQLPSINTACGSPWFLFIL